MKPILHLALALAIVGSMFVGPSMAAAAPPVTTAEYRASDAALDVTPVRYYRPYGVYYRPYYGWPRYAPYYTYRPYYVRPYVYYYPPYYYGYPYGYRVYRPYWRGYYYW
jgi:hypothetical protein